MKILFVHAGMPTFAKTDYDVLSEVHDVREFNFPTLKSGWGQIIKKLPALWQGVKWADLTFSWFGKLHAFFAILFSKIFGKKSIVVAGGDDVAHEPKIRYGMFSYWWKKWCPLFVFKYADLIIPVSAFNKEETIDNAGTDPTKVELLYHGFDSKKWQRVDSVLKEKMVITVGSVTNETYTKKGLKLFVQSAKYFPDVPFILVGPWKGDAIDRLRAIASSNVDFTGGLFGEDLVRMYSRAKVYVQASAHESFGCSVAEAMLCECIPVVSRRAALPEVVGDCGFCVEDLEPKSIAKQIKEALSAPEDLGKKAMERIKTVFPLEKRKRELLETIEKLMD